MGSRFLQARKQPVGLPIFKAMLESCAEAAAAAAVGGGPDAGRYAEPAGLVQTMIDFRGLAPDQDASAAFYTAVTAAAGDGDGADRSCMRSWLLERRVG